MPTCYSAVRTCCTVVQRTTQSCNINGCNALVLQNRKTENVLYHTILLRAALGLVLSCNPWQPIIFHATYNTCIQPIAPNNVAIPCGPSVVQPRRLRARTLSGPCSTEIPLRYAFEQPDGGDTVALQAPICGTTSTTHVCQCNTCVPVQHTVLHC